MLNTFYVLHITLYSASFLTRLAGKFSFSWDLVISSALVSRIICFAQTLFRLACGLPCVLWKRRAVSWPLSIVETASSRLFFLHVLLSKMAFRKHFTVSSVVLTWRSYDWRAAPLSQHHSLSVQRQCTPQGLLHSPQYVCCGSFCLRTLFLPFLWRLDLCGDFRQSRAARVPLRVLASSPPRSAHWLCWIRALLHERNVEAPSCLPVSLFVHQSVCPSVHLCSLAVQSGAEPFEQCAVCAPLAEALVGAPGFAMFGLMRRADLAFAPRWPCFGFSCVNTQEWNAGS